jgi:hypothetical protein
LYKLKIIAIIFIYSFGLKAQEKKEAFYTEEKIPMLFDSSSQSNKKVFLIYLDSRNAKELDLIGRYFKDSLVNKLLEESFYSVVIFIDKKNTHAFVKKHNIDLAPAFLVFNSKKHLLKKIVGVPNEVQIHEILTKVLATEKDFVSMDSLNAYYKAGNREIGFITEYLKRKCYEEGPQALILEEYLKLISDSEYQTEKVLGLISNNIVSVNSNAFRILAGSLYDIEKLNSLQKDLILAGIGNAKTRSLKEAIVKNNLELLEDIIVKIHQTAYSKQGAELEEMNYRYDFAKLRNDFNKIAELASIHTKVLMQFSPKMYKDKDIEQLNKYKEYANENRVEEEVYQATLKKLQNSNQHAVAMQLNEFAIDFLRLTNNKSELKKAIGWIKFAISLENKPGYYLTYARLLEKINKKHKAKLILRKHTHLA